MKFSNVHTSCEHLIVDLFGATFTASEGAEEGRLIRDLAHALLMETSGEDLQVFTALDDDTVVGAILFTRLRYENDPRSVFVMAPVAVAPGWQGQGIGQKLITYGLDEMRQKGVSIAVTYGDPNYYGRVGYKPVSQTDLPAPFELQHPEGWLAQPLAGNALTPVTGPCQCVKAFNNPLYW